MSCVPVRTAKKSKVFHGVLNFHGVTRSVNLNDACRLTFCVVTAAPRLIFETRDAAPDDIVRDGRVAR